jgi:enoyl-CoA hydratase/carnithine racemase
MDFSPPESLKYEARNGVCYITINRPQSMNALNLELQRTLPLAIEEFESEESLYVAVITGAGGRRSPRART